MQNWEEGCEGNCEAPVTGAFLTEIMLGTGVTQSRILGGTNANGVAVDAQFVYVAGQDNNGNLVFAAATGPQATGSGAFLTKLNRADLSRQLGHLLQRDERQRFGVVASKRCRARRQWTCVRDRRRILHGWGGQCYVYLPDERRRVPVGSRRKRRCVRRPVRHDAGGRVQPRLRDAAWRRHERHRYGHRHRRRCARKCVRERLHQRDRLSDAPANCAGEHGHGRLHRRARHERRVASLLREARRLEHR